MDAVRHAELLSVDCDEVVVTFVTDPGVAVVTRVGEREVETVGPYHTARVAGLEPGTEHELAVERVAPDRWLPARVRTLARPPGPLVAVVATVNDVHVGETGCGAIEGVAPEVLGPVVRAEPGEPPYAETMARRAVEEIAAAHPDVVLAKGDLTDRGTEAQLARFRELFAPLGDRFHFVRGNHDAKRDPRLAREGAPYALDVGGATLAVLDTAVPFRTGGALDDDQVAWLDDIAEERAGPVLVFGHHPVHDVDARYAGMEAFGVDLPGSRALVDAFARHENLVAYSAGHTHRSFVRRFAATGDRPFGEVSALKDLPGVWAEVRVHERGLVQVLRRVASEDARRWTERTRAMFGGFYREWSMGTVADRCFSTTW